MEVCWVDVGVAVTPTVVVFKGSVVVVTVVAIVVIIAVVVASFCGGLVAPGTTENKSTVEEQIQLN